MDIHMRRIISTTADKKRNVKILGAHLAFFVQNSVPCIKHSLVMVNI